VSTNVIAEIGGNHNGSLDIAMQLIDVAAAAGCDYVKFQKRTPHLCVPEDQQKKAKQTPWGTMSYLQYRERMEFDWQDYLLIDAHCKKQGIQWFASAWDIPAAEFLSGFGVPYIKVPSAMLTNWELLEHLYGETTILSTGMSTPVEIERAVSILWPDVIMHSTSTYPCPPEELNLRCLYWLQEKYGEIAQIGYSGHETGLAPTLAAVAMGATWVERHITLDRSMWGSDQAASVEPTGLQRLVHDIRLIERSLGDGIKRIMPGETEKILSLRG